MFAFLRETELTLHMGSIRRLRAGCVVLAAAGAVQGATTVSRL